MGCRAGLRRRHTVCLLIPYCLAELVAIWKQCRRRVNVMNLSVWGFVTLGLPGIRRSATPPVCWKRWRNRIIVFLWQPNALLTLEMLSPRASIVNAWSRWFWFSLGLISDKRCEIKCVFPYVEGIRIMSIHISCDMYLRLGLHVQVRLYYVLSFNAKISAQHGIGFIFDRCIVYLGLTMPNLLKKRLLIFEIVNIKKCILFFFFLEPSIFHALLAKIYEIRFKRNRFIFMRYNISSWTLFLPCLSHFRPFLPVFL